MPQRLVDPVNAPEVERRLASASRAYLRALAVAVAILLVLVAVSDLYVVGLVHSGHSLSKQNHQSLVILQCAVAQTEQPATSRSAARAAFDRCVAHH